MSGLPPDASRSHQRFYESANNGVYDQRMSQDSCQNTDCGIISNGNAHQDLSDLDAANELFVWCDDYLGSNTSMLDILETDLVESSWHTAEG